MQQSAEDYLESILRLEKRNGTVRSIDIAQDLGFTRPSVSVAMKNLRESGYIEKDKDNIRLTNEGRAVAGRVLERHELLMRWLKSLGVDDETAAADACRIEHVVSEQSYRAICESFLRE